MNKTSSQNQNPALTDLEVLAGDWNMELSGASFLPNPSDKVSGHVSFEWIENGAFLVLRMGGKPSGPPDATWLIGRDETAPNYTVLYFDTRKVSRLYKMSFSEGLLKMWRSSQNFSQRFEGKVSTDGDTISANWQKSFDGIQWEDDFNVTYTRIK